MRGAQTKLEAVAVTSYRDFLPAQPTLPPRASFLEPAAPCPDTEAFLDILKSRPISQVPRTLDDTALLQYTSGTTGTAKAAEITHKTSSPTANCSACTSARATTTSSWACCPGSTSPAWNAR